MAAKMAGKTIEADILAVGGGLNGLPFAIAVRHCARIAQPAASVRCLEACLREGADAGYPYYGRSLEMFPPLRPPPAWR